MSEAATRALSITVADIQRAVARRYGVSVTELRSARRSHEVMLPRLVAIYLARTLTPYSLPTIGRLFGNRDHTTIMRAVAVMRQRMAQNAALLGEVTELGNMAARYGESVWRSRMPPEVEAFDAALNKFGFELAIVPIGTRAASGFVRSAKETT